MGLALRQGKKEKKKRERKEKKERKKERKICIQTNLSHLPNLTSL